MLCTLIFVLRLVFFFLGIYGASLLIRANLEYFPPLHPWSKGKIKYVKDTCSVDNRGSHWSIKILMYYTSLLHYRDFFEKKKKHYYLFMGFYYFSIHQPCHKHHSIVTSNISLLWSTAHTSVDCPDCVFYRLYCWESIYVVKFFTAP